MPETQRLVVVGNGMAGARFVEEILAKSGPEKFAISMFGDEPHGNYNRILLSGVLSGTHDSKDIYINPLDWYERNGVTLFAGVKAIGIDRQSKSVYASGGHLVPYDKLVLATGSLPFMPPINGLYTDDGALAPGVFAFRTLDDCTQMINHAANVRRAVVIGGGLLGLEAARGLMNRGLEVHVVHLAKHLMENQLDAESGGLLKGTLEEMGVTFHLEKLTQRVTTGVPGDNHVNGVEFNDGTKLDCEMVVVSAGIRPNVDMAKLSGLNTRRGILVNDDLSCRNDPNIYAIGECIEHRSVTYGLVAPAWEQATILAGRLTMTDPHVRYEGSRTSTKLKVMGVELAVAGNVHADDEQDEVVTYVEPSRGVYKKLIVRDGHIAGAILLGDGTTAPRLLQAFDRDEQLPKDRAELLFPIMTESLADDIATLPDETQICNCNGVTKGAIVEAVNAGNRSYKSVSDATRAGSGCGSCKSQVEAVLEFAADGLIAEDPSAHYYVPSIPMGKTELIEAIKSQGLKSVSAVFKTLAGGREDPVSKIGLASLLKTIWDDEYDDERDARFINDRVHANIQKDGTFSVVPRIYGGITTPAELRRIADVAEKYNAGMVKITGGQRIDLLGIPKENLPHVWKELGMPSGHAYTKAFRTCKTCVGTDFCRFGLGDSTQLGIDIEKRFQGVEMPHKVKMAVSGCPRNCAEATVKDVGVVAIEGGKWEIYVGGAAGASVRKGDVLAVVDSPSEAIKVMGRFLQYYRENAKYLERTYGFVERIGIEPIRKLLMDETNAEPARLDEAMQATVASYVDPWLEGLNPIHESQFLTKPETVATGKKS